MQTYTLARTGDVPLKFEGEHLAGISTQQDARGNDRNRWYELDLYRTRAGTYVVAVVYLSLWDRETGTSRAVTCNTPEGVRDELRLYDPLADVAGYPPGDAYAEKQRRLENTLRLAWDTAIKDLFADLPKEDANAFAEVIE